MILDHFLKRDDLSDDQKAMIKKEYESLLTQYTCTNKQFRNYTIRSIQKMFSDASFIKRNDYSRLKDEDLLVTALMLKAILIRFRAKNINPTAEVIKKNNPDFDLNRK